VEDRESDSDFDPEKQGPEAAVQQWDDEENCIADALSGSNQLVASQEEADDFESKSEAEPVLKSDLSGLDEDADVKSMQDVKSVHSNQLSETS